MITIGEVIHGLELLVDNADAGFMSTTRNLLDIRSGFAHVSQLLANMLRSFDGSLRVEFG
jgi:hypothetical protein